MIDEQNAFEVINLVLQTRSEKALGLEILQASFAVEEFGSNLRRPLHLVPDIRHRETAFLANCRLIGCPEYPWIDEDARFVLAVLARQVHHQNPFGDADL